VPFQIENKARFTALFIVFINSGWAIPFFSIWFHMNK
jgi:hypothetical protein